MDPFIVFLCVFLSVNFLTFAYVIFAEGIKVKHLKYVIPMLAMGSLVMFFVGLAKLEKNKAMKRLGEVDLVRPRNQRLKKRGRK